MSTFAINCAPTNVSTNALHLSDSPGSGTITINGANAVLSALLPQPFLASTISITSSGNDAAKTVAIVGLDDLGGQITETLQLTNAGVAVSAQRYRTVNSITLSAAAAANITVGFTLLNLNSIVTVVGTPSGALTFTGSTLVRTGVLGAAQKITLTSGGNDSNGSFTVVGTDADGNAQTETLTGGNIAAVTTTQWFKTVTSITKSNAVVGTLIAGCAIDSVSPQFSLFRQGGQGRISVGCVLNSGTATYELQDCYTNVLKSQAAGAWINSLVVTAKTASFAASYGDLVPFATRLHLSASTSGNVSANFVAVKG